MNPVQPEELSALLDGELNPEREREIHAQLAADPQLNAQFEALRRMDASWRAAAATARFVPVAAVAVDREAKWGGLAIAALVSMLLPIRFVPKLIDIQALALALNVVALACVVSATIWLLRNDSRVDAEDAV